MFNIIYPSAKHAYKSDINDNLQVSYCTNFYFLLRALPSTSCNGKLVTMKDINIM
jgi:hypothetical protein